MSLSDLCSLIFYAKVRDVCDSDGEIDIHGEKQMVPTPNEEKAVVVVESERRSINADFLKAASAPEPEYEFCSCREHTYEEMVGV